MHVLVATDADWVLADVRAALEEPGTTFVVCRDGRAVTAGPVQPWTWQLAELFKIEKGQIRRIEALLHRSPYGMLSGWSTLSQGMSDAARDVTME